MTYDPLNPYRSKTTGFIEKGNRKKKILNLRWRRKKAAEFVINLSDNEYRDLKKAIKDLDPIKAQEVKERSGLRIFEELQQRGKSWVDKVRGKK